MIILFSWVKYLAPWDDFNSNGFSIFLRPPARVCKIGRNTSRLASEIA